MEYMRNAWFFAFRIRKEGIVIVLFLHTESHCLDMGSSPAWYFDNRGDSGIADSKTQHQAIISDLPLRRQLLAAFGMVIAAKEVCVVDEVG